jgi:beta-glucanase (GH16 family)
LLYLILPLDTNLALHYYHKDNAKTENGVLSIKTESKDNAYRAFNEKTKKFFNDKKYIQSSMLQGWNKFCFTGGIVEFSAKLPGSPRIGGLWPARKFESVAMLSSFMFPSIKYY